MLSSDEMTDKRDALWDAHGEQLTRFAMVLVGPHDAHDVAIDAFLGVVDDLASGNVAHPTSFLYRAVSNRAHDLRRSRGRRWRRDLQAVGPARVDAPDTYVDVRRAVAQLSLMQRAVIYFVYWEDRTERDTAQILGITPGTVRRHVVRARVHLRKALQ